MLQIITSKTRPDTSIPEGKQIWSPNPGLMLLSGILYELNLRELYDRIYHGRVAPSVLFRLLDGAQILAVHEPAVETGDWPSGTILKYENHGRIQGIGGNGGKGGDVDINNVGSGENGGNGGDALLVSYDLEMDNTDGEVFAGGGGGGGGGGLITDSADLIAGSGGGGGAGTAPGSGGERGIGTDVNGEPGSDGTSEIGGAGGTAGIYGGDGGGQAESGDAGLTATGFNVFSSGTGGAGGSPGNAITQSGATITIVGGNNSTQIKGAVV